MPRRQPACPYPQGSGRTRPAQAGEKRIYQETLNLGGVLTGEHGIGQIRNNDLDLVPDKKQWELMWGIKKTFDPNNILSPRRRLPPNH